MLTYLLPGILASFVHVISGPDHLAAVTPLAIESRKKSWIVGFSWGVGHTIGMLLIGLIFLQLKQYINIDSISITGEQIVGYLLIAIGIWAFIKVFARHGFPFHLHNHIHTHGSVIHVHKHSHKELEAHTHNHLIDNKQNYITALGIGVIHGVAGVSHLVAVLPTLALPSRSDAVFYLSGFGSGTILTMILYAFLVGLLSIMSLSGKKVNLYKYLRILGGSMAIIVGLYWIISSL